MEPTKSLYKHPDDLPANLATEESERLFERELEEEQDKIIREVEGAEHSERWWHAFSWKPTKCASRPMILGSRPRLNPPFVFSTFAALARIFHADIECHKIFILILILLRM
jgi:hypothetical protein